MLSPVTHRAEVSRAVAAAQRQLQIGAVPIARVVGWQGGHRKYTIHWHPAHNFWSLFGSAKTRHWCVFGTEDPAQTATLSITCEINPPIHSVNRRCAGIVLRDTAGHDYLAHTGRFNIRGGMTKDDFFSRYVGQAESVIWPDRQETEVVVIGRVDSTGLPRQVATFVREVERIKDEVVRQVPLAPSTFRPEFSGIRASYSIADEIEARVDHGYVVKALQKNLLSFGIAAANDRHRDLYAPPRRGRLGLLFEVKTLTNLGNLYGGIGQLLFHGVATDPEPHRILVLPASPKSRERAVFDRLEIRALRYRLNGTKATFVGLKELLADLGQL
ncbi:MAG: hypothetical protein ACR2NO_10070 [Chloroflexota bacterium]